MGCHTWAYRLAKPEEVAKAKVDVIQKLIASPSYISNNKHFDNKVEEMYIKLKDLYKTDKRLSSKITKQYVENLIIKKNDQIKKILEMLEDETQLNKGIYEAGKYLCSIDYKLINNNLYIYCGFDVPVRIYGYPEVTFTSAQKFIDYIIQTEEHIGDYVSTLYRREEDSIHGFCKEMESAIIEFWKKYDNNVYIEFG